MNYSGLYQPSQPPLPPPVGDYASNPTSNYMTAPPPPPITYNPTQINYASQMSSSIPLPPPSMDESADEYSWNSWNSTPLETPHSPPHFERKGHEANMIEYIDENLRTITDSNDIDHRLLMGNSDVIGKKSFYFLYLENYISWLSDVDHRNLISLTGSPGQGSNKEATMRPVNAYYYYKISLLKCSFLRITIKCIAVIIQSMAMTIFLALL